MSDNKQDYLELKWGTIKGFDITSEEGSLLLKEYIKLGACSSRIAQVDTPRQKEIICQLIDLMPGKIYLEWDKKRVSKEDAKKYVMEYGQDLKQEDDNVRS